AWLDPAAAAGPVEAHYARAGYLNAQARASAVEFEGARATLPIQVREGRQFVVAEVQVDGTRQVPEAEARAALGLAAGSAFTPAAAAAGANALRELYASLGHVDARVRLDTTYDRERSTARLAVSVEEGVRRTIAGVELAGDIATREAITSRALTLPESGPVNVRQVEETQRKLYDLGVFRSVEPRFEPVGEPVEVAPGARQQPVRVVYDVQEHARYRLRYGFQVASGTLSTGQLTTTGTRPGVTVDLRRNNLFGLGFDVGAGTFLSSDRTRLRGIVQSSTLGGRPVQTTLTLTRDRIEGFLGSTEVSQRRSLLAAEQRWRPTLRTEFVYGYDLEYDDADLTLTLRNAEPLLLTLQARLASANSTFAYDTRDNVLNPSRGTFHSGRIELGTGWLGSELRFARYFGQHYLFVPAGRVTLASALRFGTVGIDEAQEESLESLLVRFTTGGGTSVRGYRQDALTPEIIEGFPRGGDVLLVLNQEARVRLTNWIGVVGFIDAGNAFATWQDASLSGLEIGIGTGLRLTTPVGVIRLDVGFPRPRPANHPVALWYFSFGQAF
nr:BamA/TamA family outer membrane protein [Vicinamibacterales bacterium]